MGFRGSSLLRLFITSQRRTPAVLTDTAAWFLGQVDAKNCDLTRRFAFREQASRDRVSPAHFSQSRLHFQKVLQNSRFTSCLSSVKSILSPLRARIQRSFQERKLDVQPSTRLGLSASKNGGPSGILSLGNFHQSHDRPSNPQPTLTSEDRHERRKPILATSRHNRQQNLDLQCQETL